MKMLAPVISQSLATLFPSFLAESLAVIFLLLNKGWPAIAYNYCLINLTSITCKSFERIITDATQFPHLLDWCSDVRDRTPIFPLTVCWIHWPPSQISNKAGLTWFLDLLANLVGSCYKETSTQNLWTECLAVAAQSPLSMCHSTRLPSLIFSFGIVLIRTRLGATQLLLLLMITSEPNEANS